MWSYYYCPAPSFFVEIPASQTVDIMSKLYEQSEEESTIMTIFKISESYCTFNFLYFKIKMSSWSFLHFLKLKSVLNLLKAQILKFYNKGVWVSPMVS